MIAVYELAPERFPLPFQHPQLSACSLPIVVLHSAHILCKLDLGLYFQELFMLFGGHGTHRL